jgi:hypothetical protein
MGEDSTAALGVPRLSRDGRLSRNADYSWETFDPQSDYGICGLFVLGVVVGNSRSFSGRADTHRPEDHLRRYRIPEAGRAVTGDREGEKEAFQEERYPPLRQEPLPPRRPSRF